MGREGSQARGVVKIYKKWYKVSEQYLEYDGRLDGMKLLFARYPTGAEWTPFVFLWGDHNDEWPGPACVDGFFPWCWWYEVKDD